MPRSKNNRHWAVIFYLNFQQALSRRQSDHHCYSKISLNIDSNFLSKFSGNLSCEIFKWSKTISNLLNPPSFLNSTHSTFLLFNCFLFVSESLSATKTLLSLAITASALSGLPRPISLTSHLCCFLPSTK